MRKRILIVAESIDVEDSSGSKANVALIENLSELGYDLKVYHYTRKDIQLEGTDCIAIEENRRSLLFLLSRTERYLRYVFNLKLNKTLEDRFGFSFTLLNDRNSIAAALNKEINFEPDLVLTLSKGGSFRPHHAVLKIPDLHEKWLAYIHDPYPMHWYPPPYPWFEPGFKQKENFMKSIALHCRITAFPSQLLKEWMGQKFQLYLDKGVVIPHQIRTNQKKEIPEDLPAFLDPEKFNLVHAGNLIQGREPFGILKGFKKFLERNPGAKKYARLIFLGGKNYYSPVLDKYAKENPQFYNSSEVLPFSRVQSIQKNAAVNLILEAKSSISPFLPGKFPHCIEANKKILLLSPEQSESKRLLGKNYSFHAEIDDVDRISDHISQLYSTWEKNPEDLNLNRKDLYHYLSVDSLKLIMDDVFNKMK